MIVLFVLVVLVFALAIYDYKQFKKMHFAKSTDGEYESNNNCSEIDYEYFDMLNPAYHENQ